MLTKQASTNNKKPILIDAFCKAGGSSKGYAAAGFDVVGIDIDPQRRYPFDFLQMDALEAFDRLLAGESLLFGDRLLALNDIAAVGASPPCQVYSVTAPLSSGNHPALIEPVREKLVAMGKPYAIKNVPGAPLINPLMLCGTMFDLRVIRHRLFECKPPIWFPPASCNHWSRIGENGFCCLAGDGSGNSNKYPAHSRRVAAWRDAIGIDWMIKKELAQAVPPAYTEYIGRFLLEAVTAVF